MNNLEEWESRKEAGLAGYTESAITRCAFFIGRTHKGYIWRFFGVTQEDIAS